MITAEKIKVFDRFGGDEDGLARVGSDHEKKIFEANDDWFQIINFYQDVTLINNQLASADYVKSAIEKMRRNCNDEAYKILMDRIGKH